MRDIMRTSEEIANQIIEWLKTRVKEAGAKGVVFGLSGGIDSAVVAALAKRAFGDDMLGIIMPCNSLQEDEEHARLLAKELQIPITKVDLSKTYNTFIEASEFETEHILAKSNVKPRLRMTTLYYFGQANNYLVCGTSNKSEYEIGYFTKYGDSGSDLLPIVDLIKEEVRDLAIYLGVPKIIVEKAPSAGLWEGQTDEDEMGISYKNLDAYIKGEEVEEEVKNKIQKMNKRSEHKRRFPLKCELK
jgi:NAD+ synthase